MIGIRGLLLLGAVSMLALIGSRFEFRSDISNFMPGEGGETAAAISRQITDSELSRSMILSVGADELPIALEAARSLEGTLERHPNVAWIRTGIDRDQMRHLYELYFPRRYYFLSPRPEDPQSGVAAQLDEAHLRAQARELRRQLALPASPLLEELAVSDPIGSFRHILERVRGTDPGLQMRNGQFVSRDGRRAIILLATRNSAFDTSFQAPFLADLTAAFEAIRAEHPQAALTLERSGVNRFAVKIEESIQADVVWIIGVSFVGVALLFLIFFRSPTVFGLAALPSAYGILIAATVGVLIFGDLDALTVAFGASLIGVAIDYSIHLMNHHGLSTSGESPAEVSRRLRPPLMVGALTTMASFTGLALTSFPGFRQMGVFAIVGVASALAMTLWVLPKLLEGRPPVPEISRRLASELGRSVMSLSRHRLLLSSVPLLTIALCAIALPRLEWNDDISSLSELDPDLLEEDIRVRDQVSQFDSSRLAMVSASDEETALRRNDELALALDAVIREGDLAGTRSLHSLLWSSELQRRNLAAVRADPGLADRVDASFTAEGFRSGVFAPFRESLASEPPPPLSFSDLRDSAAGDLVRSMVLDAEDSFTIVTYLRGVESEEALRDAVERIPGARVFSQSDFLNEIYAAFRTTTLRQIGVGSLLVIAVLLVRYRRVRPAFAAFLPSILTAGILLSLFALMGVQANLIHIVSLVMVMGMGVDYGVFMVDSGHSPEALGATMLSLLLSCLTTVFVFGTLAISTHPALRAMGITAGLGVALTFFLAPVTLIFMGASAATEEPE